MTHETAGDPVSGLKWTHRTTAKLAHELRGLGIHVCPQTVARLLKAMGYSLRVNHKKLAGASHPNRDQQFRYITELRERCATDSIPVISVDTKKNELVGAFRNPGAKWDRSPELVNDRDFPSDAEGLAIPYGIYDPRANAGTVFVGRTADTPARSFMVGQVTFLRTPCQSRVARCVSAGRSAGTGHSTPSADGPPGFGRHGIQTIAPFVPERPAVLEPMLYAATGCRRQPPNDRLV